MASGSGTTIVPLLLVTRNYLMFSQSADVVISNFTRQRKLTNAPASRLRQSRCRSCAGQNIACRPRCRGDQVLDVIRQTMTGLARGCTACRRISHACSPSSPGTGLQGSTEFSCLILQVACLIPHTYALPRNPSALFHPYAAMQEHLPFLQIDSIHLPLPLPQILGSGPRLSFPESI